MNSIFERDVPRAEDLVCFMKLGYARPQLGALLCHRHLLLDEG